MIHRHRAPLILNAIVTEAIHDVALHAIMRRAVLSVVQIVTQDGQKVRRVATIVSEQIRGSEPMTVSEIIRKDAMSAAR